MSLYGGFDQTKHFSELATPLDTGEGVLSPSVRMARAREGIGQILPSAIGGARRMVMPVPATATASATLTAAQVLNGVLHGTPAAAVNYTLPLAATLEAALPADFAVGEAIEFSIVNLAATATFDITVVTNTGWTLSGPMVVGAGAVAAGDGAEWTAGVFRARKTAAGAYTLYRVA